MKVFSAAAKAIQQGTPAALVTVIEAKGSTPRHAGARMLVYADGAAVGTIGGGAFEHRAMQVAIDAIGTGCPARLALDLRTDLGMCCGGRMEVYVEPLEATVPALLFGAGHINSHLAPLLTTLGFQVQVVDERPEWVSRLGAPVDGHAADPVGWLADATLDARTHVLIATHDHQLDQDLAEAMLSRDVAYIGVVGSRAKLARFRKRYAIAGVPASDVARIHGPVGLDLGGQSPAEVALSIAAEWVWRRRAHGRPARPLSGVDADGAK